MKMKIVDLANVARILRVDLADVEENLTGKVVDLFMFILPHAREYDLALSALRKDAQGKKLEEIENLTTGKAFEKVANTEVDVEPCFTKEDLTALAKKKLIKVADLAALYPLVITE